jgi:hypothetical protein
MHKPDFPFTAWEEARVGVGEGEESWYTARVEAEEECAALREAVAAAQNAMDLRKKGAASVKNHCSTVS